MIRLTRREKQILEMIIEGLSVKDMCKRLNMQHRTQKFTSTFLYKKFGVKTRQEMERVIVPKIPGFKYTFITTKGDREYTIGRTYFVLTLVALSLDEYINELPGNHPARINFNSIAGRLDV